jgi:2-polyprenyl-3-methyl-5-hydroxy-6-metoxy-1,4-benzoquinol methylase
MGGLEFTGERLVPGLVDPELALEHEARYRFAATWAPGRAVLDFGCGTGYGAAILARAGARRVVGVDRAVDAIHYAQRQYRTASVSFCVGDCLRAALAPSSFDLVVAFEVIEHVVDQRRFLHEARTALRASGILVL